MKIAIDVETKISQTVRAQQIASAFDVPPKEREPLHWRGNIPLEEKDWNIGLIVGPSGAGKSTILRDCFGKEKQFKWSGDCVMDDFPSSLSVEEITAVCSSVGFNTIPAWLRPYRVLSNGEQFRVGLARTLIESQPNEIIAIDEFTSVVDRQVAKIGAHAVQKWVRKHERQLVVATCHYDVLDWLRPDWVLEPATMNFAWKEGLQRPRPPIECVVTRVPHSYWRLFAPYHYMSAELHRGAACFCLFTGEELQPAAFAGVLHRPVSSKVKRQTRGVSRVVTLPDWQGLGLAFVLMDLLGAAYTALGYYLNTYPAHPALIRNMDRSPNWHLLKKPGMQKGSTRMDDARTTTGRKPSRVNEGIQGTRPNAVFRYIGETMELRQARNLIRGGL